ncbi:MAG: glucosamine--fructose-6-phosphate aminotransferase (isomerizing) [Rickettsiales bacterium]|jgi:glucosamine--fructose-6-phosphate aminotransferase (isomerizing)
MCGIVGIISKNNIVLEILEGLKKLEYRGYDSAGISLINGETINTIKKQGKIVNLESAISKNKKFSGNIGIGHTRWATHGKPSEKNSHPHQSDDVSVVHNGIIENYQELKTNLQNEGVKFQSQTDTEIIPHLISSAFKKTGDKKQAIFDAISRLHGAFALAIIFKGEENFMAVAKKGSPLLIGFGKEENYVASDYFALDHLTDQVSYLEDGDVAFLSCQSVEILDANLKKVSRKTKTMEKDLEKITKGDYQHFMQKEIFEQPRVIRDIADNYISAKNGKISLPNFPFDLAAIDKITIVACGTSYYSALVGKYLIESLAKVNVEVDIASEFRYRNAAFYGNNLNIFISQSGETADTIAALKYTKEAGQKTLGIVNVAQSNMAYLSDAIIRTIAGPEIGVASTKAYIAQVSVLILFALELAELKKTIDEKAKKEFIASFLEVPDKIEEILKIENLDQIKSAAKFISKSQSLIYIGRGVSYPTALEGALKLKELSYINAFGIASGELKHGTIALIDEKMPVIAIAPNTELFEKSASNIEEIVARGGKVILIGNDAGIEELKGITHKSIRLPKINNIIDEALTCVIPTQLIAYFAAIYRGNDVDQPRNLAKSVTVE